MGIKKKSCQRHLGKRNNSPIKKKKIRRASDSFKAIVDWSQVYEVSKEKQSELSSIPSQVTINV